MESAFVLAEKPPLEILTQVRNGLPAAMYEKDASDVGTLCQHAGREVVHWCGAP